MADKGITWSRNRCLPHGLRIGVEMFTGIVDCPHECPDFDEHGGRQRKVIDCECSWHELLYLATVLIAAEWLRASIPLERSASTNDSTEGVDRDQGLRTVSPIFMTAPLVFPPSRCCSVSIL